MTKVEIKHLAKYKTSTLKRIIKRSLKKLDRSDLILLIVQIIDKIERGNKHE